MGLKVAVFVDGCFWHGHPDHFSPKRSGAFWARKIQRNKERDRKNNTELGAAGWKVLRFWDFEIDEELERCVASVAYEVASRRGVTP